MTEQLPISHQLIVLRLLKIAAPSRPTRASLATVLNPRPTERDLEIALARWEAEIDRLHTIKC